MWTTEIKKHVLCTCIFLLLAGAEGIEPTLTVLETAVLPLYDTPSKRYYKFLAIELTRDISTLPAKLALKCFIMLGIDLSSSLAISLLISSSLN